MKRSILLVTQGSYKLLTKDARNSFYFGGGVKTDLEYCVLFWVSSLSRTIWSTLGVCAQENQIKS